MQWSDGLLADLGLSQAASTGQPASTGTFPDGAAFRVEIPSVEGPRVLEAVLAAAEAEGVTVNRASFSPSRARPASASPSSSQARPPLACPRCNRLAT